MNTMCTVSGGRCVWCMQKQYEEKYAWAPDSCTIIVYRSWSMQLAHVSGLNAMQISTNHTEMNCTPLLHPWHLL